MDGKLLDRAAQAVEASSAAALGAAAADVAAAAPALTVADYVTAPEPASEVPPVPPTVAEGGTPVAGSSLSAEELEILTADIIAALKTVYDPEIPSDIYELGLIYKIDVSDNREVSIDMTLTAPGCPVAGEMPIWVENAVNTVAGVSGTKVTITFDPPWNQSRMSDEAKLAVGMF